LQGVAVCCSVLQCVAVCCSVLQCEECWLLQMCCKCVANVLQMCCTVLHCVAVCCTVLQCVAVRGVLVPPLVIISQRYIPPPLGAAVGREPLSS